VALALYRKYRPATFAEVVGQEHVTAPLMNAVDNGRINHAYLFSGPRGCGKTSSARILARSLNCEQGPTSTPCGVCTSCVSLAPDGPGSIDVIEIDAASHGGVDDARDLRERAFFAPVASRYKVYIVDEAHMVTPQGFNALLKVVEEPPEFLVFVFATTEPDKVLPTIRSRTHHYPFRLVPPTTLRGLLEKTCTAEGVQVEPTVFPLVVRAGGGSVRDSLSILDQLLAGAGPEGVGYKTAVGLLGVTDDALLDETIDALAASDAPGVFRAVDRVVEAGHDPRRFATDLLDRLRDLIVLDAVPDAGSNGLLDTPPDRIDLMSQQAKALGPATLSRMADTVHEGLTEMRGTTAPRLLLELVCARMLLPAVDGSATAVLQRLERLERRMSIAGEHAGRPVAEDAPGPAPVREAPVEPAAERPEPGGSRREYVRPSRRQGEPADTDWPETTAPGSAAAPSRPRSAEPDVPLPPEPTDDEDWPQPARPPTAAPARAAESSPAPRGAEPTPVVSANPPEPPAAEGELTTADVRRMWPELLAVVKRHKRTTEALLKNAQVHELRNNVLVLSTASPALSRRIADDLNKDVLREALNELLGVRWKVEAVVEGGGAAGSGARPGSSPGPDPSPAVVPRDTEGAEAAEAREILAQRAAEASAGVQVDDAPAVDPEQAALSLLRAQLGARPIDG
jgi:DNA polymerase III subunit gamma/tau